MGIKGYEVKVMDNNYYVYKSITYRDKDQKKIRKKSKKCEEIW